MHEVNHWAELGFWESKPPLEDNPTVATCRTAESDS
jgi:hypothetical protein